MYLKSLSFIQEILIFKVKYYANLLWEKYTGNRLCITLDRFLFIKRNLFKKRDISRFQTNTDSKLKINRICQYSVLYCSSPVSNVHQGERIIFKRTLESMPSPYYVENMWCFPGEKSAW